MKKRVGELNLVTLQGYYVVTDFLKRLGLPSRKNLIKGVSYLIIASSVTRMIPEWNGRWRSILKLGILALFLGE